MDGSGQFIPERPTNSAMSHPTKPIEPTGWIALDSFYVASRTLSRESEWIT